MFEGSTARTRKCQLAAFALDQVRNSVQAWQNTEGHTIPVLKPSLVLYFRKQVLRVVSEDTRSCWDTIAQPSVT